MAAARLFTENRSHLSSLTRIPKRPELPHRGRASTNLAGDGLYWIGYQEITHPIDLLVAPGAPFGLLLRASVDEHKAVPPGSSASLLQFLDQRLDFQEIERTCLTSERACL
jgi:hypothetical protein